VIQIWVFWILDLAEKKFVKNSKLFLMILILGKTYICIENPEKNTGIFRCFFWLRQEENIGFSCLRFSWKKFVKNSKLFLMILILGKTYICITYFGKK
jgi:hypothetical protein